MSAKPTAHKPDIQRLIDEGYEVEIRHNHLLVNSVPYVTPAKVIALGAIVCPYSPSNVGDHQVSFGGETPCNAGGKRLDALINNDNRRILFDKYEVQFGFSNKPEGKPGFPSDYYEKVLHYINILVAQARVIDPEADARTGAVVASRAENSVFKYGDTASARCGITAISQKLAMNRVAIVGLGGTGGYILDQLAKTHIKEIHLFDDDKFNCHNAFRAPGAASFEMIEKNLLKVNYFCEVYGCMRSSIIPHAYKLCEENIHELTGFDFVFVSVDDGLSRGLICAFLKKKMIPFIDVGMDLKIEDGMSLSGQCRITFGDEIKNDHLDKRLPVDDDRNDAVYRGNIQVADMNAMNALIAVMRWKQYCGFYSDVENTYHSTFSLSMLSIVREDKVDRIPA